MQLLLRLLPCFFSASFSHFVSGFLPVLCSWPWGCWSSLLRRMWWVLHPLYCSLGLMTGLAHQFPGTLSFQSLFPHLWFISQGNIKPCKNQELLWNKKQLCALLHRQHFFLHHLIFWISGSSAWSSSFRFSSLLSSLEGRQFIWVLRLWTSFHIEEIYYYSIKF